MLPVSPLLLGHVRPPPMVRRLSLTSLAGLRHTFRWRTGSPDPAGHTALSCGQASTRGAYVWPHFLCPGKCGVVDGILFRFMAQGVWGVGGRWRWGVASSEGAHGGDVALPPARPSEGTRRQREWATRWACPALGLCWAPRGTGCGLCGLGGLPACATLSTGRSGVNHRV